MSIEPIDHTDLAEGDPKTGLILEALMLALPGFVERAESLVLAGGKIQTLKTRKHRA